MAAATAENVETLKAMFPDHDADQLSSALVATGSVEAAIQQLLEGPERTIVADEVSPLP